MSNKPSLSFNALTPLDVLLVEVKSAVRNRDADIDGVYGQRTAWRKLGRASE